MTGPDPFASVAALGSTTPRPAPAGGVRISGIGQLALPQAVKQWRDAATEWIRVDDPAGAAALAARRPPSQPPRLVVVGETNRGKSSLVNALLGRPGLSPVDAGVATCSYLVFLQSDRPYAVARFGGGLADVTFPPADLPAWAMADGEPDVDLPPPRWIEVGVDAELSRSVTLVDTPGVGGLVAAHAELAADAAASASALLFVVDASAPLIRGELDFLASVADRVDCVHFAVTKTDAYRGWREIVDADRTLLARYAPRFTDAPFHAVSSRLADAAAGQPNPEIAAMMAEQSGVPRLRSALTAEVGAAAAMLFDANTIRTAITVLAGGVTRLQASRQALTAGAAQGEALRARREELLGQRKTGGRSWQVMLRAEIQRARVDLTHETAREVREAMQIFRGSIDQADSGELKNIPLHIDAYAQAMTQRAHGRLTEAMARICRTVLSELFTPAELTVLASQLATKPYERLTTRSLDRTRNMDETIMTLSGAGMGFTLSRLVVGLPFAALPAAFGIALAPVSIVVGGAAAFYLMRSRKRMAEKQHLKQWLGEVLGEAKAQIDQNIAEQFVDADEQLTLALDDALNRQVAALDTAIREVDGALKLDTTERTGRLRAIDDRRQAGSVLAAAGEQLLQRMRTARTTLPPVPQGVPPAGPSAPPAATAGPAGRTIQLPAGPGRARRLPRHRRDRSRRFSAARGPGAPTATGSGDLPTGGSADLPATGDVRAAPHRRSARGHRGVGPAVPGGQVGRPGAGPGAGPRQPGSAQAGLPSAGPGRPGTVPICRIARSAGTDRLDSPSDGDSGAAVSSGARTDGPPDRWHLRWRTGEESDVLRPRHDRPPPDG